MTLVIFIIVYSAACETPKWQCPWTLGIMSLEVEREAWDGDMDQGDISIDMVVEILGEEELTCGVCTKEAKRKVQVSTIWNTSI